MALYARAIAQARNTSVGMDGVNRTTYINTTSRLARNVRSKRRAFIFSWVLLIGLLALTNVQLRLSNSDAAFRRAANSVGRWLFHPKPFEIEKASSSHIEVKRNIDIVNSNDKQMEENEPNDMVVKESGSDDAKPETNGEESQIADDDDAEVEDDNVDDASKVTILPRKLNVVGRRPHNNEKSTMPHLARMFTAPRRFSSEMAGKLAMPHECLTWRLLAKDASRLRLYKEHFTSHDFTDWFLFVSMFTEAWHEKHHNSKRRPMYLDVAANHAKRWSNTYFFDRCMGWDGICVEANPQYHNELRTKRHCTLIPYCVADYVRPVDFSLTAAYGGVVRNRKDDWGVDGKSHSTEKKFKHAFNGIRKMTCTTLKRELQRLKVDHVDFMSLDVEGFELPVLRGIDWDKTTIDVLVVENRRPEVGILLKSKGYSQFQGLLNDVVYIRKGSGFEVNNKFVGWARSISRKDYRIRDQIKS